MKADLMRNPDFDIGEAYRMLSQSNEISRDNLLEVMGNELDQPHIDILFAKMSASSATKTIAYADFIECITPRGTCFF